MKEQYFYETASAKMLEFDKIISQLESLAFTEAAKEKIKRLAPCLSESEVKAYLRNTTEAKVMIEKCQNPPITALEGIGELMERPGKGECLTAGQLEKIGGTLTAVKRLKDYLCRGKIHEISLAYYE